MIASSQPSARHACVNRRLGTAILGLALAWSGNAPAADPADSESRIAELEHKLEQALQMIGAMQAELAQLKTSRQSAPPADPGTTQVSQQNERLDQIEETVVGLEERVGNRAVVHAFDAMSLDVGGFLHQTFTLVDGEDETVASFNKTVFELLLKAQLTERWSAFVAQAFARESADPFSAATGGSRENPRFNTGNGTDTETVIAWADYRFSDALGLRFGRLISPQGIVNIEHFPAVLLDPEQPQFLRPFGSDTLFANFTTGVDLHGNRFFGADQLAYNAYSGNFAGNANDLIYGARGAYTFGGTGITIGLNYNGGSRRSAQGDTFDVFGADLRIDKSALLLTGEVFASEESGGLRDNRTAWYIQPAFRLNPKWTVFYRYDFLDNGTDEGDSLENVFGITYKPRPNIHLRALLTFKDFDRGLAQPEADARIFQVSGTLSF